MMGTCYKSCIILFILLVWIKVVSGETRPYRDQGKTSINEKIRRIKETYSTDFFWPTLTGCCKIGEKVAKKRLSCDTHEYMERKNFYKLYEIASHKKRIFGDRNSRLPKHVAELIKNTQMCVFSRYSGNFKKCCHYQMIYREELVKCRTQYKSKSKRRQCRKDVHKRYP